MRMIDADALKEKILAERDMIPKTIGSSVGAERPYHHGNAMRGGIRKALRCLEQTSTIDPESQRPKGEWIIEWEYERNYATGEADETPHSLCPFCGNIDEYGVANNDPYWAKPHNFCPNCGADMRGENK